MPAISRPTHCPKPFAAMGRSYGFCVCKIASQCLFLSGHQAPFGMTK